MKPSPYRFVVLGTLIHLVVHTYYPEDMKQLNICFEVNLNDLYKDPIPNNAVCNSQSFQKLDPSVYPPLPYSKGTLKVLKKFHF